MTVATGRAPLILAGIAAIILLATIIKQMNAVPTSWTDRLAALHGSDTTAPSAEVVSDPLHVHVSDMPTKELGGLGVSLPRPTFYEVALSHGTDKVTKHHYHHMYEKYLSPLRDRKFKMLEIGLGCDMSYGPGASYYTWLEYFTNVDLYFIEYDQACAEKWAVETSGATIFPGDQANVTFLQEFVTRTGSMDVIIDDGGHQMHQQRTSLVTLFPTLRAGGLYFCEDLQTSYWPDYGGDPDPLKGHKKKTMMGMVKEVVDDLNVGPGGFGRKHGWDSEVGGVDCMEEVCAFVKKGPMW
ncbi:transcription factor [Oleoguttula sp. CCFEE 5521]